MSHSTKKTFEAFSADIDEICPYRISQHNPVRSASNSPLYEGERSIRSPINLSIPLRPILVVSDSSDHRAEWTGFIAEEHYQTLDCTYGNFLAFPRDYPIDLSFVVCDLDHCTIELQVLFRFLKEIYPQLPVILMGTQRDISIPKEEYPDYLIGSLSRFEPALFAPLINSGLTIHKTIKEKLALGYSAGIPFVPINMIGDSPAFVRLNEEIRVAAQADGAVLLTGERGTRKDIVAVQIHWQSQRRANPFDVIQTNIVIREIQEPYLFGQEPNVHPLSPEGYVGRLELMDHGSILLNEIEYMGKTTQEMLLSYFKTKTLHRLKSSKPRICDTRVFASGSPILSEMVDNGGFSQELYNYLCATTVRVPALREFIEGIPGMVQATIRWLAESVGAKEPPVFSDSAIEKMMLYSWPGNTVEFEQVMHRAVFCNKSGRIGPEDLVFDFEPANDQQSLLHWIGKPLDEIEKRFILETLWLNQGNRSLTAKTLGISEKTLYNKLREYEKEDAI